MLPRRDTIAAIATVGGAIGIVRVSGPLAARIGARVLRGAPVLESHRARRCVALAGGARVDEVLAILMRGPRSYTGEDVLELQGHGGQATTLRLLEVVCDAGARPAEPGEFTRRALAVGRLSLLQAEAVAEVVAARSVTAARVAQASLAGELDAVVRRIETAVVEISAELVAWIDFPEEDLALAARAELARRVLSTAKTLGEGATRYSAYRAGRDGAEVAIVGLANAGKSSLFNALAGQERALVSERPGTTRDVIEAQVCWSGQSIVLLDTAGRSGGDDELERRGMALGMARAAAADVRLVLLDGSVRETLAEEQLVAEQAAPRLVARAKSDLPTERGPGGEIRVSSRTGEGLEALRAAVIEALGVGRLGDDVLVPQTLRQQVAMQSAAGALEQAGALLAGTAPLELAALELDVARGALGELRGLGAKDDVLDVVFGRFCIGK